MENNRRGRIRSISNAAAVGIVERSAAVVVVVVVVVVVAAAVDQVASSRMEQGDGWMQQRRIGAY